MSFIDIASRLKVLGPHDTLQELARHFEGKPWDDAHPRPRVTLYTCDGHSFAGWLLGLAEDSPRGRAVLFKLDDPHSPDANDVLYVTLDRVSAVVVHGAER